MKLIIILSLCLMSSNIVLADWIQAPAVEVNEAVLGGDILLINMKEYLVITGVESAALAKELRINKKNQLTKDIILEKSVEQLEKIYHASEFRPTTSQIINRYAEIIFKLQQAGTLN